MSGSASKGILRNDQIPASTSSIVPVNTRKRFCAHQSIQREITLHSSRGIHAELFVGDDLPVLLGKNRDLPRSPAVEFPWALVESVAFFGERNLGSHRGHAHRWHGRHGKGDGDFRTRDGCSARIGELYAEGVAALVQRIGFGREVRLCLWSIDGSRGACAWRWRNKRTECGLELAFGIDQKIGGRDDFFSCLQSF